MYKPTPLFPPQAIGGGGYIPARMLRTEVKIPILAISLELYDDATKTANDKVLRKQWFDETPGMHARTHANTCTHARTRLPMHVYTPP
jgi:hypothetical protein